MSDDPSAAPVEVKNADPIPVAVIAAGGRALDDARVVKAAAGVEASILRTEDQRRISGMWERTQQLIALSVVLTSLAVSAFLTVTHPDGDSTSFVFLASVANLVIGFYFGRTNHTRVGGTVSAPEEGLGR